MRKAVLSFTEVNIAGLDESRVRDSYPDLAPVLYSTLLIHII